MIRQVAPSAVRRELEAVIDAKSFPEGEAKDALRKWADEEVARLLAQARPSDEIWLAREEKGAGTSSYRTAFLLLRNDCVIHQLDAADDN